MNDLEKLPVSARDSNPLTEHASHSSGDDGDGQKDAKEDNGKDRLLVDWDGDMDPSNPLNWSETKKWAVIVAISTASMCVTCTSSMIAPAFAGIAKEYHVGTEVAILGLSLFVAGLGLGPLFLGPLSEFYGRNRIYYTSYIIFLLLNLPVTFSNNVAVFMIFRFASGVAGSSFLSVSGGSVSDLWPRHRVGRPMAFYTASPFLGPVMGPLISGFINQNTTWRWTFRVILIWCAAELVILFLFIPETYGPLLLKKKAQRLRKETGDPRWRAPMEESEKSVLRTVLISCTRPFKLLAFEPVLFLLCLWSAIILGILYLFFEAFPIVFQEGHGFNVQCGGLAFLGIGVGLILGLLNALTFWSTRYERVVKANGGSAPPEARLPMCMLGALLVPIGMFWFAFTSYPAVHWIVPVLSGVPFGWGVIIIYIGVFTYTIDHYRIFAASALAANSFMRSSFAAGFPLFATQMYDRLGTPGASALLAGLNVLMVPLPFLFYKYGPALRSRSRFLS